MDTLKAIAMDDFGSGIVVKDKREYHIPNLLPGETAEIRLFHAGKGKVARLLETIPERIKPVCPWFNECGGCQLQHIPYSKQLEIKTGHIKNLMEAAGLNQNLCLPCIGMKEPYHYRNKAQMVISEKNRKVMAGFFEENTHQVVNVDHCPIQNNQANAIIKTCRTLFQKQKIQPYDEDRDFGLIRYVLVRTGYETGQILVIIVTAREMFPGRNNFIKALREAHPEVTSIVQNVNPRHTSIVLGDFERVLYGKGSIEDLLLGKRFLISARTFFQINHKQTEIMYKKALELAKPKPDDIIVELYSGVGAIGIIFSGHVKKVIGVELNRESVKNAMQNVRMNQVRNVKFYAADAKNFLSDYLAQGEKAGIMIVDPPREGLDTAVIEAIIALKPEKLCYLSCNPETLIRDLRRLVDADYEFRQVQPIDMFPQTSHVESVVMLVRK